MRGHLRKVALGLTVLIAPAPVAGRGCLLHNPMDRPLVPMSASEHPLEIRPRYTLDKNQEQALKTFLLSFEEARKQPRKALRVMFSFVDQALLNGWYTLCDSLLDHLDPSKLDVLCATGFLAITLMARNELQRRASYAHRLESWLRRERPEDVDGLLAGLK